MRSKVLTTIPSVAHRKGKGALICAGHSVAPEKVPPGMMAIECHRCGRLVLLARTPHSSDVKPPTPVSQRIEPSEGRLAPPVPARREEATGAAEAADVEFTRDGDATEGGQAILERGEVTEVTVLAVVPDLPTRPVSAMDLSEIEITGDTGGRSRLSPPVEEPTQAHPPPLPDPRPRKKTRLH